MTDEKQPEALRLFTHQLLDHDGSQNGVHLGVDDLEICRQSHIDGETSPIIHEWVDAAELRRLHAANLDCMDWYEAIKSDYEKLKAEHEALRKAVIKLHAANGRYHNTRLAVCDLFDLCGLPSERPAK